MQRLFLKTVQETLDFLQKEYARGSQILSVPKNCQFFSQKKIVEEEKKAEKVEPNFALDQYIRTKKSEQIAPKVVEKAVEKKIAPTPIIEKKEEVEDDFSDLFARVRRLAPKLHLIEEPRITAPVLLIASDDPEEAAFLERLCIAITTKLKRAALCKADERVPSSVLTISFNASHKPRILLEPVAAYQEVEKKRLLWNDLCQRLK